MAAVEVAVQHGEVLVPGERTLGEYASEANEQHRLACVAGEKMLRHAIASGQALIAARQACPHGSWGRWLAENFEAAEGTAYWYMRFAAYADELDGVQGLNEARELLRGRPRSKNEWDGWAMAEARRLREEGLSLARIGARLGVHPSTVWAWLDPDNRARRARHKREMRLRREEARAKRMARRAGGARAEAYAMAERLQDVLAKAHEEADSREARRAWSEAGVHYRKMRDEIVRAFGVS